MKYIFDFDDVLFMTTKMFKRHMYKVLEDAGVDREEMLEYYRQVRGKEFSLKNFIKILLERAGKDVSKSPELYEKIMKKSKDFTNTELIKKVKELGKENCYIITNGDDDFQRAKIKYSSLEPLFKGVLVVPESKKEAVYKICDQYKDEKVIFVDDKTIFFNDLDLENHPNLETVLYTP